MNETRTTETADPDYIAIPLVDGPVSIPSCQTWDMHNSWYALPERHEHLRKTLQAMAAVLTDYAHDPAQACRLAGWIGLNGAQGTLSETIAMAKGNRLESEMAQLPADDGRTPRGAEGQTPFHPGWESAWANPQDATYND